MNDPRSSTDEVIRAALMTLVTGELELGLFSDDVISRSPMVEFVSGDQLRAQLSGRRGALTSVELDVTRIETEGTTATVHWRFAADHTGPMPLGDDVLLEPTGRRVAAAVTTQLAFRDGRVCAFEHDYDADHLFRQMGWDPTLSSPSAVTRRAARAPT